MKYPRIFSRLLVLVIAPLMLTACTIESLDGYFQFGDLQVQNSFHPDQADEAVNATVNTGVEFTYDQVAEFGSEVGDFVLSVDLDGTTITLSMSSTEESNLVSAVTITLDNFAFSGQDMRIAGVIELDDDFSGNEPDGMTLNATSTRIVFIWPGFNFETPFGHHATYEIVLAEN